MVALFRAVRVTALAVACVPALLLASFSAHAFG